MVRLLILLATVNLTWTAVSPQPDGYRVYMTDTSGVYTTILKDVPGSNNSTSVDVSLSPPKFFILRAYNGFGESGNSNEVSAAVPLAPTNLDAQP